MIDIVFISPTSDGYGADKSLIENIIFLKENKLINPTIIFMNYGRIIETVSKNNIDYHIVSFKPWLKGSNSKLIQILKTFLKDLINYLLKYWIYFLIKNKNIQIVYTNTIVTDIGIKLSKLLNAKHILHLREFHDLQLNFSFAKGDKYVKKVINNNCDTIIANSPLMQKHYQKFLNNKKIIYQPNPIYNHKPPFQQRKISKLIKFIAVGRLEPEKGFNYLVEAVNLLANRNSNNFIIEIYGDGSLELNLKAKIQAYHLNHIIKLKDFQPKIMEIINEFQVGLLCAPFEPFGRVVIEYLISGLPVICTKTCGVAYQIIDGFNGYLYDFDDIERLADLIDIYISNYYLIDQQSLNAYSSVDESYSVKNSSLKLYQIIEESISF